jgi:hypothetical protein
MPRFFFQVRDDSSAFDDTEGEVLQGPAAAAVRAEQIARELAGDGDSYRGYQVIALDESGNETANCPVAPCASSTHPERESGGRQTSVQQPPVGRELFAE